VSVAPKRYSTVRSPITNRARVHSSARALSPTSNLLSPLRPHLSGGLSEDTVAGGLLLLWLRVACWSGGERILVHIGTNRMADR